MMSQKVTLVQTKQNKRKQLKTTNIGGKCWQHTRWLESLGKPNKNYILEEKSQKTETCWDSEKNQFEL